MSESFYFIEQQSSIKCAACKQVKKEQLTYLCYLEESTEGKQHTRRLCTECGMLQLKRDIRKSQKLLKKLKKAKDQASQQVTASSK